MCSKLGKLNDDIVTVKVKTNGTYLYVLFVLNARGEGSKTITNDFNTWALEWVAENVT